MNYKEIEIIEQRAELQTNVAYEDMLKLVENAGRTCYLSHTGDFEKEKAEKFIGGLIKARHSSVIEHGSVTFRLTTNRAIANELVRHRIASYSQESTRYVNYAKDGKCREAGLKLIKPLIEEGSEEYKIWHNLMQTINNTYEDLIASDLRPDKVRGILPLDLATTITVTMNMRSLRNFLKLRLDTFAHPQIQELASLMIEEVYKKYPIFVKDIYKFFIEKDYDTEVK